MGRDEDQPSPLESRGWSADLPATAHVEFFRSRNWDDNLLGPLEQWGLALRIHMHTLFADSRPSCIYWGARRVAIYNEAFVPLAGATHPRLMGIAFRDGFPEIWQNIEPIFDQAEASGLAVDVNELPLMVMRNNFLEESFFTGNFNPIRGDDGRIHGFYNSVWERTGITLSARRTAMLNKISSPPEKYNTTTVTGHFVRSFETNPYDIPMLVLYRADEESVPGQCIMTMTGSIGLPAGHTFVTQADIKALEFPMPLLRKSRAGTITVEVGADFDGVKWRGFAEPSKFVSVVPLEHGGRLFGCLLIGANPRRPIDSDHHQFMADISRHLSHTLASLIDIDEARKRQERLEAQLAGTERQIRYLAQHASVAMAHLSLDGSLIWANDHYYTLTGFPRGQEDKGMHFMSIVHPDSHALAMKAFSDLVETDKNISIGVKLNTLFIPPTGDPEPTNVLAFGFSYYEDGKTKSLMSCMTDVSQLKWAEAWQARSAEEAREAKRNQEQFIDSISHEVRNPLSAIFQLADGIVTSYDEINQGSPILDRCLATLGENVEAAKTIIMCAEHQKRIVDDVLTLSKLDFMLISLKPSAVSLSELVTNVTKMFGAECTNHVIALDVIEEPSLLMHKIEWVICDPSRVMQVFINLISNAIKFTKSEASERRVTVKYGACLADPQQYFPKGMVWAPKQDGDKEHCLQPEYGPEEHVYLTFSISDTGTGMTRMEVDKIFSRFSQASTKTFIKYGGSGLGLFISQRLSEKQGGDIGVISSPGAGSTFAFYIKSSRTAPPVHQTSSSSTLSVADLSIVDPKVDIPPDTSPPRVIHVILVEDNLVNQQIVRKQLTKAGCVVHVANHGIEALSVLKTLDCWQPSLTPNHVQHLDFILMDLEMPIMDGLTCAREIRRLQKEGTITRHIDIIAITANTRKEQIDTAIEAGMDDVLSKPFVVSDLMAKMRQRMK
ncbi:hypothetical protein BP5796_05678 [Coleophoma crateriformis]|uniref:histidine kinase n=1 Tax=Coleophoma crateriformis TaxID=565419 RepID=A0A3D8S478_9HELO|nr:hypothetical protein BP5796_05678 [Coleophoma crateriformis]